MKLYSKLFDKRSSYFEKYLQLKNKNINHTVIQIVQSPILFIVKLYSIIKQCHGYLDTQLSTTLQ